MTITEATTSTLNALAHLPHVTVTDGSYVGDRFVGHAYPSFEGRGGSEGYTGLLAHPDHLPETWGLGGWTVDDRDASTWSLPGELVGCLGRWVEQGHCRPATHEEILATLPQVRVTEAEADDLVGGVFPYLPKEVGTNGAGLTEYCGLILSTGHTHSLWHLYASHGLPEWTPGMYGYWVNRVESVNLAPDGTTLTAPVMTPDTSAPDVEVTEVDALIARIDELQEQYDADLATIGQIMRQEAVDREWCGEYEQVMGKINRAIHGTLPAVRATDHDVHISGTVTVPWTATLQVSVEPDGDGDYMESAVRAAVEEYLENESSFFRHNASVDTSEIDWDDVSYDIDEYDES